jgi:hypothetical protein
MDVVSFAWSRAVSLRVGALKHTMISRVPFPNCRSGVIGLAIAGNPENDGHLSPWQEGPEVTERSESTHKRTKPERGLDKHVSENPSDDGFRTFSQSDMVFHT